jgi:hypothetical protein
MSWNLEGLAVEASYLEIPVTGKVTLSRVKYGGGISHHVELFSSIKDGPIARPKGDVVIVDHESVTRVMETV